MSIRNITRENNYNIYCNELKSNNIISIVKNVSIEPIVEDEFTIETVNPNALFTKVGDYIICNGSVDIKITSNTPITNLFVGINILEFDYSYNALTDVRLLGGGGSSLTDSAFMYYTGLETIDTVQLRFKNNDTFINGSEWKLQYSFTYKQYTF